MSWATDQAKEDKLFTATAVGASASTAAIASQVATTGRTYYITGYNVTYDTASVIGTLTLFDGTTTKRTIHVHSTTGEVKLAEPIKCTSGNAARGSLTAVSAAIGAVNICGYYEGL